MERLTEVDGQGRLLAYSISDTGLPAIIMSGNPYRELIEKLKAYEDTGLEPEEIMDDKLLTGWIPVADRLPTQNMEVYASIECRNGVKEVRAAYYRDGDFVNDQGYSLHKIIKAWQPRWIPMPYDPQD